MPANLLTAAAASLAALVPGAAALAPALTPTSAATAVVAASAERCATPAMFTFTPTSGSYLGAKITREVVAGAANCASAKGVPSFVKSVNASANAQLAQWKTDWKSMKVPGLPTMGSYGRTNSVVTDVPGLVVLKGRADLYYGGAHGVDTVTYDILNTGTGALVTKDSMLDEMQGLGGPNWNFERELNHWAPTIEGLPAGPITRDLVSLYPARTGMHVAVGHCAAYACAAGVVEYTIPWSSLVAPDADLSFVPNAWGH